MLNRRKLLKTLGLGALAATPSAVSAEAAADRSTDRLHPIAILRRVATAQLAFRQKRGNYDGISRVFGEDPRRVPDDHPLKPSFLQGTGFGDFDLDVSFKLRGDRTGYSMMVGRKDSSTRYYVTEKNVIYRSNDDAMFSPTGVRDLAPEQRLWTPIVRKEFDTKTASSGIYRVFASMLNAVVPVVHAQVAHGDCCKTDYPWWWWDCYSTSGIDSCVDHTYCNCSVGYYFCVQGFIDCQGCCINCSGNCECAWDRCPGS